MHRLSVFPLAALPVGPLLADGEAAIKYRKAAMVACRWALGPIRNRVPDQSPARTGDDDW